MTRLLVAVSCGTAPRCARGAAANSVAMTPVGTRKARLLALHGFTQDAQTFRSRIGSMRKGLKSRADFVFVDAPHMVDSPELTYLLQRQCILAPSEDPL